MARWHDGLTYKMINLNFPPEIIKILQSFLINRSYKVYVGKNSSTKINIPAGCPQGSCFSPILYNIFTSDFPTLFDCTSSIFADDTAILCHGVYAEDIISSLQNALIHLEEYFKKWKILINPQKTQAIYFTRRRNPCFIPQRDLSINNNTTIKWESEVKYLGVILDSKINFSKHVSYVINKINNVTRLMYSFLNRKSTLSPDNKLIIFKAIFMSILYYAAPVWNDVATCHVKKLQISQNKLLKMIYNLPRHYSTQRLHFICGIEMVNDRILKLTHNYDIRCQVSEYLHINELSVST